ncbi:unnamed protein product [Prorocentrum cordatum]|uniref:Ras-related protein Rab-5C n=1 Tax=Prorocentrum cordatum TaxID=2364126 RepID=A0ABN9UMK9_9DINO|nr:unnamed protein product [Polarella glacialis]
MAAAPPPVAAAGSVLARPRPPLPRPPPLPRRPRRRRRLAPGPGRASRSCCWGTRRWGSPVSWCASSRTPAPTALVQATVGAAFSTKTIQSGNREVKFEIWDTAGQDRRFRSLAPMYYRGASGAVVVYDQTSPVTFERAQEWVRQVMQTSSNPNIVVALAANKMDRLDLADQRQVPLEKAEAFAAREGLLLSETSAKTGKNVAQLFDTIAEHLPEEPFVPEQRGLVMSQAASTTTTGPAGKPESRRAGGGCCSGGGG